MFGQSCGVMVLFHFAVYAVSSRTTFYDEIQGSIPSNVKFDVKFRINDTLRMRIFNDDGDWWLSGTSPPSP